LYPRSGNRKLGGLPASITSRDTCPDACALKRFGCYALYGHTAAHWRRVGEQPGSWDDFCADVARLPEGQLWRHNEAGTCLQAFQKILPGQRRCQPILVAR
jgi:hypothetical protein